MQKSFKATKRANKMIDFHIHGIGSYYKDTFATASYDHICAYFQKIADENNANFSVAITEHDVSVLSYEEYKKLQQKYPNVKLVLGMETNCNLRTATYDVFKRAHVLLYADMSSEATIKKWFECKELNDLSKINLFQIPCNYQFVEDYCRAFNVLFETNLDEKKIAKELGDIKLSKEIIKSRLFKILLTEVSKAPSPFFANCKTQEQLAKKILTAKVMQVKSDQKYTLGLSPSVYGRKTLLQNINLAIKQYNKIYKDNFSLEDLKNEINMNTLTSGNVDLKFLPVVAKRILKNKQICKEMEMDPKDKDALNILIDKIMSDNKKPNLSFNKYFDNGPKIDNFGQKLYIAKSVLNKHLNTKITNEILARILDKAKSLDDMKNEFIFWVKSQIKKYNPSVYKKIKNLSYDEFCEYKFGENKHGDISLNNLIPKNQIKHNFQSSDVRTKLEELKIIVDKTNAKLVLAHPNSIFSYRDGATISRDCFTDFVGAYLSKKDKADIFKLCQHNERFPIEKIKSVDNTRLLKLDLFFNLCKKHGINFDGFEFTMSDIDSSSFMNNMIYAAKNDMAVSFGSDTHLSCLNHYYDLLRDGKIDQRTFDKLIGHAYKVKDNTYESQKYIKKYMSKFELDGKQGQSKLINNPVIKSSNRVFPKKTRYWVSRTSICDKVLRNKTTDTMLEIRINGQNYEFKRSDLKKMSYKILTEKGSKNYKIYNNKSNKNNRNNKSHKNMKSFTFR